jgi:hypothetical protein
MPSINDILIPCRVNPPQIGFNVNNNHSYKPCLSVTLLVGSIPISASNLLTTNAPGIKEGSYPLTTTNLSTGIFLFSQCPE